MTTMPSTRLRIDQRLNSVIRTPPMRCAGCGGPVEVREGVVLHTNKTGWYAGRQMDHDAWLE